MTGHFLKNIGLPYSFVVPVQSEAFMDTHPDVLLAHSRLVWITKKIAAGHDEEYQEPNELLLVGYKKKMDMGYHDDGEKVLGPTVATLSLGATSTMFLRMKTKYFTGLHQTGNGINLLKDDPVLPGCLLYDSRRALKEQYEQGLLTELEYDEGRRKILKSTSDSFPRIKMELHHGHMVVMHGADLQRYYEHSVVPDGGLRFAATARYIKEHTVKPEDIWMGRYELPSGQAYSGE
ncbi:hypothetical protein N7509_011108 [Penicillium cosmopolitanum]|uniref:Fe2OG dioxygenase domain-containing protein n=1 Tax=Penicillium cosmopolitanum TaxID=1131564 RepID=A0A9X0B5A8_9EURO|nr:uncharacterized protein N7509_011108 [Penicillium cosmopolitanum]KAJ5388567.1 hypothetical protein N7509_011108 [Penicillium cosmopolitanum]